MANFPLHSVPGINVVDATPPFKISVQEGLEGRKCINMGNLIWSGTETNLTVKLPLDTLSRHALVCGVNGSGKTNTVLSVLDGLMKADRPFLRYRASKDRICRLGD